MIAADAGHCQRTERQSLNALAVMIPEPRVWELGRRSTTATFGSASEGKSADVSTGSSITTEVACVGGLTVTTIRGELDIGSADELNAVLDTLAAEELVVVDLSAVDFMDSSGLAVLMRQSMRRREAGGTLQIRRPSAPVQRLLAFCCLEYLLEPDPVADSPRRRWSFKRPKP